MSLLEYSEIKERKIVIYEDEPYEVLESHVARTQQRKPQNQVKMRSLINGRAVNVTFRSSDTVEEADVNKKEIKFLYHNRGEYWFADPTDPKSRFQLSANLLGDQTRFLKDNMLLNALVFEYNDEEKIIGLKLPIKMEFIVKDAPPAIKGNTAQGGNKLVTLENGATVNVPLFIEAGNKIVVNTETGDYVERA
ncbi:MAG: elongation factor P [Candidatus Paceibacterota bacterium]|jgi:elongation factor P